MYEVRYDEVVTCNIHKDEVRQFIADVLAEGGSIIQIMEPYCWSADSIRWSRYGIFWKKPIS